MDDKLVDVARAAERALHHLVDEALRAVELDDLRRESLTDTEMCALEGSDVIEFDKAGCLAVERSLAR